MTLTYLQIRFLQAIERSTNQILPEPARRGAIQTANALLRRELVGTFNRNDYRYYFLTDAGKAYLSTLK